MALLLWMLRRRMLCELFHFWLDEQFRRNMEYLIAREKVDAEKLETYAKSINHWAQEEPTSLQELDVYGTPWDEERNAFITLTDYIMSSFVVPRVTIKRRCPT